MAVRQYYPDAGDLVPSVAKQVHQGVRQQKSERQETGDVDPVL